MTLEEKLAIGTVRTMGSHTFEPDEIKAFASRYDPQRFHLSEEEAQNTHFGRLCASGWHTNAVWMRCNVADDRRLEADLLGKGETPVEFGPALGLKNLRWLRPVFAGDTITFTRSFLSLREMKKRPGWWLVDKHCQAISQDGTKVMEFNSTVMVRA